MRIAIDAMGGDNGLLVIIRGSLAAARDSGIGISFVGRSGEIEKALKQAKPEGVHVEIVDAPDVVEMHEHPAMAVRRKPRSSISMALQEVKSGRCAAMVSAGNSGAVMTGSIAVLGRIRGVERPALAVVLPTLRDNTILLDLGAVTDPKPLHLVQFAHMANVYAITAFGKPRPTIGLLSNGEEQSKGNQLVQEVYPLLVAEPGLNFVGNVEGKELLRGTMDIIVTDGFTGNVALKTLEGAVSTLSEVIRDEVTATLPRKIASLALRRAFASIRTRLDYEEIGGAPLLGVNGVAIVAHGRSDERAFMNAVKAGKIAAEQQLPQKIRDELFRQESAPAANQAAEA